jgi:hypothetical protein
MMSDIWNPITLGRPAELEISGLLGLSQAAKIEASVEGNFRRAAVKVVARDGNQQLEVGWGISDSSESFAQTQHSVHESAEYRTVETSSVSTSDQQPWKRIYVSQENHAAGSIIKMDINLPYGRWDTNDPNKLSMSVNGLPVAISNEIARSLATTHLVKMKYLGTAEGSTETNVPSPWIVQTSHVAAIAIEAAAQTGESELKDIPRPRYAQRPAQQADAMKANAG